VESFESQIQDSNGPVASKPMKKMGIDFLQERVEKEDSVHPYLQSWFEKPWLEDIRRDERFR
jgi:hypothetical protein